MSTASRPLISCEVTRSEKRLIFRFSLLSMAAHGIMLVIIAAWSGFGKTITPPLRVLTVELDQAEPPRHRALPTTSPPISTAKLLPVPAPPVPEKSPTAPALPPAEPLSNSPRSEADGNHGIPVTTGNSRNPPASFTPSAPLTLSGTVPILKPASKTVTPLAREAGRSRETPDLIGSYLAQCRALIEQQKEYPVMARRGRMEGNVKVRCEVSRDGSLRHSVVTGSSGHTLLDNAALRAVRNVRQFPPMTLEQYGDTLVFKVPITFRLSAE